MRLFYILAFMIGVLGSGSALAEPPKVKDDKDKTPQQVQVTAQDSLEYYSEKRLYVARGNAKAIRGQLTVTADTLTAHEREKPAGGAKQPKPAPGEKDKNGAGDIDLMTAEGHVVIVDPRQRITGEHAIYDLDKHKMIVTGKGLRYETAKEVVTAQDSLEYYEDTKLAVARGHAVADQPTRHVEGDVLTAEFQDAPNGQSQLSKMTSQGHVVVLTKSADDKETPANTGAAPTGKKPAKKGGDVSRGDRAVYNAGSNVAVLTGNVRVMRPDGTELTGDVGEVDFNSNQSRLMNDGHDRVQALLPASNTTPKTKNAEPTVAPQQPSGGQ